MILPGNSRQVLTDALRGLSASPTIAQCRAVNDLGDAGFRIVAYDELREILEGLLRLLEETDPTGQTQMSDSVLLAAALLEVLKEP